MSLIHTGSFFYREPNLLGHDTTVPSGISACASGAIVVVSVLFSVVYNVKWTRSAAGGQTDVAEPPGW